MGKEIKGRFVDFLNEAKGTKPTQKIEIVKLPFALDGLQPVLSKQNVDQHYNVHTKKYIENANKDHDDFNTAGAILHNMWWEQLRSPKDNNAPSGKIGEIITKRYKSFAQFKQHAVEQIMSIRGSGWLVMSKSGALYTIANHRLVDDCALIIDGWEHSYYPTYLADKKKYANDIWRCINWDVVNSRL